MHAFVRRALSQPHVITAMPSLGIRNLLMPVTTFLTFP